MTAPTSETETRLVIALGMAVAGAAAWLASVGSVAGALLLYLMIPVVLMAVAYPVAVRFVARRSLRLEPHTLPAALASNRGRIGTIVGPETTSSPCTNTPCVAFAVDFVRRSLGTRRATLRDAVAGGFDVALDDGQILRVPASRIRVADELHKVESPEPAALVAYLDQMTRGGGPDHTRVPVPYDELHETVFRPGDRVELVCDTELVPDSTAEPRGYREPAPSVLRPLGVPWLRRIAAR